MITLKARVRRGRVVIDETIDLPDETELELAPIVEDDMDDAQRAALEAALARSAAEIAAGRLIDGEPVLDRLGRR